MSKKMSVHFMGIGGSGVAPIAIIAKKMGFEVSGCDAATEGYYYNKLKELNIEIMKGHDEQHLNGIDVLAVTPAIFDLNPDHPEIVQAGEKDILMTWQEFMGKYIQKDKKTIAISGTHGKSTTTVLMANVLEVAGLEPWALAGTIYKPWGSGARIGDSEFFVCEADEFNNNFHNYHPGIEIINNIEMDHPEFFEDFTEVKNSFKKFIMNLTQPKILVVNEESQGIREVLDELKEEIIKNDIKVIGYYIKNKYEFPFYKEYKGSFIGCDLEKTMFEVTCSNSTEKFEMMLKGLHNISNTLGVIAASMEIGIETSKMKDAIKTFEGIGRRSELICNINDIMVFDDYAHHPTEVSAVINAFKLSYPDRRIIIVIEPHQISRLNLFFEEFSQALSLADYVIVTKVFLGREKHKKIEPIDINQIISKIGVHKAVYEEKFDAVLKHVTTIVKEGDTIVVLGAGESYKLTREIAKRLTTVGGKYKNHNYICGEN